ncbi:MAG TPA: BatA and WFA domain-containing protein [Prolixibacteraceae bacterium]|nr:BatA and WFA domain-containing protein [Prolixibacteraceae bacterium]
MRFIDPSFLWALGLVAVPIIIHLVNLRKHQTVYFSNVNFLKKVKKESQRKSKLKQLLILLCRVMLIVLLVIAFAKPYKPTGQSEKLKAESACCIYIDNSFSMAAEGPEGVALESAKQKAYAIVNASQPDTKFSILTNDLSEKHYRFFNKQEITQLISEVEESHNQVMMSTILTRFKNLMDHFLKETDKRIYLISDFQKVSCDLGNIKSDSVITYNFIPVVVNQVPNLFVDSCWFGAPAHYLNQIEQMEVNVVNNSNEEYYGIPVNLYINDSLKALATVDLAAHEKKAVTLKYTNLSQGLQLGRIEISDYPIVYDNAIYFSYHVNHEVSALLIKPGSINVDTKNIEALFANDPFIHLDVARDDRLQISQLGNYSAIFLYELADISSGLIGELKKYVGNGGVLAVIPAIPERVESYNSLLASLQSPALGAVDTVKIPVGEVFYDHPLYQGVFKEGAEKVVMPSIKERYRFNEAQDVVETALLSFPDKTKALTLTTFGKGKVYLFAFPFSKKGNEFVNHILFVPTVYNIALFSSPAQQLYYVLGKDRFLDVKNPSNKKLQSLVVRKLNSSAEFKPTIISQEDNRIQTTIDPDAEAGLYQISLDDEVIDGAAINYELKESDLTCYSSDEIRKLVGQSGIKYFNLVNEKNGNLAGAVYELDHGIQRWKIFVILALFFLLAEMAIIKFWDKFF